MTVKVVTVSPVVKAIAGGWVAQGGKWTADWWLCASSRSSLACCHKSTQ